jgi:hypothetical protein
MVPGLFSREGEVAIRLDKYGCERRRDFFWEILQCSESVYGLTDSYRYQFSEFRYRLHNHIVLSDQLKQRGYKYIVRHPGIEFVYRLEACGLRYVGKTVDPYGRYFSHITGESCSSIHVMTAAMDNRVIPKMEIIDFCDKKSVSFVENFWMTRLECVNSVRKKNWREEFDKKPATFKSVMAHQLLGFESHHFSQLLPQAGDLVTEIMTQKEQGSSENAPSSTI